jgi:hypothetical protein
VNSSAAENVSPDVRTQTGFVPPKRGPGAQDTVQNWSCLPADRGAGVLRNCRRTPERDPRADRLTDRGTGRARPVPAN